MRSLFLHIGTGKTGSTSIQRLLFKNRKLLSEEGFFISDSVRNGTPELPQLGRTDSEIENSPFFKKQSEFSDPTQLIADFKKKFSSLFLEHPHQKVIISNEVLFSLSEQGLNRIVNYLSGYFDEIKLIVYLRRQDEVLISSYNQALVFGCKIRIEEYLKKHLLGNSSFTITTDYNKVLSALAKNWPDIELIVRPYDDITRNKKGVFNDFLEAVGSELRVKNTDVQWYNKSFDCRSAEYMRRYNLKHNGMQPSGDIVNKLKYLSDGPKIEIDESSRLELLAGFLESNAAVTQKYFPQNQYLLAKAISKDRKLMSEIKGRDLIELSFALLDIQS